MKEHSDTDRQSGDIETLVPSRQAKTSVVLNGVGNGMMVGTIPFVALELYSKITQKDIHKSLHIGNAFAMVTGCALGGFFGMQEAKSLHKYRESLVQEVKNVKHSAQENKAAITQWTEKTAKKEEAPDRSL